MIIFYPRDIGLWRDKFSFDPTIGESLDRPKTRSFYSRQDLIEFLKLNGVRLDDAEFPLEFLGPRKHHVFGMIYDVKQWTLLGWIRDELI